MLDAEEEVFRNAVQQILQEKYSDIDSLSASQHRALLNFVRKKDVLAILPTGSGKSLIFQMAPAVIDKLREKNFDVPERPILLVICPLNSLIDSHVRELRKRGYSASVLTRSTNKTW